MLTQILQTGNSSADFYGFLSSVLTLETLPGLVLRCGSREERILWWRCDIFRLKQKHNPRSGQDSIFAAELVFGINHPGRLTRCPGQTLLYI